MCPICPMSSQDAEGGPVLPGQGAQETDGHERSPYCTPPPTELDGRSEGWGEVPIENLLIVPDNFLDSVPPFGTVKEPMSVYTDNPENLKLHLPWHQLWKPILKQ